ncbi:hypothetical protein J2Z69_001598 [Paenibacillus shirakamiensis]|uniref:PAS domain-containing protein n=1 Tax=Paenibacillus shirakamiensis TaxID=1265935 RepID=A0ABS4JFT9_9BACL|nr:hypothetical protein [Paenibacillus shirakamiensis]MBP2000567.1 hypothetical protein [Paenibacillus shirakamiensis]
MRLWKDAIHSLAQSVIIIDLQGQVELVNTSWIQLGNRHGIPSTFEWTSANLLMIAEALASSGDPFAQLLLTHYHSILEHLIPSSTTEMHNYYPDRTEWGLLQMNPLKCPVTHAVTGIIISVTDITNIKHTHTKDHICTSSTLGLEGLLPICAVCKNVRDEHDEWHTIEQYLAKHAAVEFTHDICTDCIRVIYPKYSSFLDRSPEEL